MTLNRRLSRFAQEYLIDLNATQAAIRAGYSPRTAYSAGQRLLNHVEVIAKVSRLIEARAVAFGGIIRARGHGTGPGGIRGYPVDRAGR